MRRMISKRPKRMASRMAHENYKTLFRDEPSLLFTPKEKKDEACGCGKGWVRIKMGGMEMCRDCFMRWQHENQWNQKDKVLAEAIMKDTVRVGGKEIVVAMTGEDLKFNVHLFGDMSVLKGARKNYQERGLTGHQALLAYEWFRGRVPFGRIW